MIGPVSPPAHFFVWCRFGTICRLAAGVRAADMKRSDNSFEGSIAVTTRAGKRSGGKNLSKTKAVKRVAGTAIPRTRQSAARQMVDAVRAAALRVDRAQAFRSRIRGGAESPQGGDREDRGADIAADVRQHHRGARARRAHAQPRRRRVLQSDGRAHERGAAGSGARDRAAACRARDGGDAQPQDLHARGGSL